ncbi:MAG: hypothetical protein AAFX85_13235 [Pseudomonadota bacterium]
MALSRYDHRFPAIPAPAAAPAPWALNPLRVALLVACIGAALTAPWWSEANDLAVRDPELATLLRFLGVVKLGLALLVGAGVWWRLAGECSPVRAVAYCGGVALMVLASLLILMLSRLPQAAASYHGAAFAIFALIIQDKRLPALLTRLLRR